MLPCQRSSSVLQIILEHPSASFIPGESIVGEVVLNNKNPTEFKSIRIRFYGRAKVEWSEIRQTGYRIPNTHHFTGEEVYFTEDLALIGNGADTTSLPPGTWRYPFAYKLPHGIPSSFSHHVGTVSYMMQAIMKGSWCQSQTNAIKEFKVDGRLNLSMDKIENLRKPLEIEKEKIIYDMFCRPGKIMVGIKLDRSGFVSGDYINFQVYQKNHLKQNLNPLKIRLLQVIEFKGTDGTRKESNTIVKVEGPKLLGNGEKKWEMTNKMKIPESIPYSGLGGCKIIDVQYILEIKLELFMEAFRQIIPLMIGYQ